MTTRVTNCWNCGEPIRQLDDDPWRHVYSDERACPNAPVATPIPTGGPSTPEPPFA